MSALRIPNGIPLFFVRAADGSVAILFAVLLVVILGSAGLAIDYGRTENIKSSAQVALDAAVLAGAAARDGKQIEVASSYFAGRFDKSNLEGFHVTFGVDAAGELSGTAEGRLKTTLVPVLGFRSTNIRILSSAARSSNGKTCALILAPATPQALLVNGGADVNAPDCRFDVKSTASPAAIFNSGTSLVTGKLCIEGTTIIDNGGLHAGLETGCKTLSDPYAGVFPAPASAGCDFNSATYSGTVNLTPGVYCGWHNFNAAPDVTLAPGTYVIKGGGWNVDGGSWQGSGVVFYFADPSKIQFNSAVSAKLTSPTSGAYAGVAFFEKDGLANSQLVFDDSKDFDVSGLIYLPSRDVTFNAASKLSDKNFVLVVNTLILDQTVWALSAGPMAMPVSGNGGGEARLTR